MKIVSLFSDGSCLNNPGNGGWAYILEYEKYTKNDSIVEIIKEILAVHIISCAEYNWRKNESEEYSIVTF